MSQNENKTEKDIAQDPCEEVDVVCDGISSFDRIIGVIEDILVDENFQELQKNFLEQCWEQFDDGEENRLIYMDLFHHYVDLIEENIEKKLIEEIPNFNMEQFYNELRENQNNLDGEVFEMLYTLSDFTAFKEMVLDYKAEKEGKGFDFSKDLCVTAITVPDAEINVS